MPISSEELSCIRIWMQNNIAAKEPVTRVPNEMLRRLLDEIADVQDVVLKVSSERDAEEIRSSKLELQLATAEQRAAEGETIEWTVEFKCPRCGGSHFGRSYSGPVTDPKTTSVIRCGDEFHTCCRWTGPDEPDLWVEKAERPYRPEPAQQSLPVTESEER